MTRRRQGAFYANTERKYDPGLQTLRKETVRILCADLCAQNVNQLKSWNWEGRDWSNLNTLRKEGQINKIKVFK
jgi:hypothetical protein